MWWSRQGPEWSDQHERKLRSLEVFDVSLERVDPPDRAMNEPAILDARGQAPEQYPSWEE